jgi:hypothetical protein
MLLHVQAVRSGGDQSAKPIHAKRASRTIRGHARRVLSVKGGTSPGTRFNMFDDLNFIVGCESSRVADACLIILDDLGLNPVDSALVDIENGSNLG